MTFKLVFTFIFTLLFFTACEWPDRWEKSKKTQKDEPTYSKAIVPMPPVSDIKPIPTQDLTNAPMPSAFKDK